MNPRKHEKRLTLSPWIFVLITKAHIIWFGAWVTTERRQSHECDPIGQVFTIMEDAAPCDLIVLLAASHLTT